MKRYLLCLCISLPLLADWSLSGGTLLLRPSVSRPYAAILAPSSSLLPLSGSWVGNTKPSYAWGYQISLGYQRCSRDIRLRWNSWIHTDPFTLRADTNQQIFLTFIHPSVTQISLSPGLLRRHDQFRVQGIDGEFGCSFAIPFALRGYGGVRYTRIRYNVNIDASGLNFALSASVIQDRWESDIQGIGPRGGVNFGCDLPFHFQFFADLSASLLLGTAKGRYFDLENTAGAVAVTRDRMSPVNLMIGNFEASAGSGWKQRLGCFTFDIAIDYLWTYFLEGTVRAQFFDSFSGGCSAVTRDPFSLDGWRFHVGVEY